MANVKELTENELEKISGGDGGETAEKPKTETRSSNYRCGSLPNSYLVECPFGHGTYSVSMYQVQNGGYKMICGCVVTEGSGNLGVNVTRTINN